MGSPSVFIITGEQGEGKTLFAGELSELLKKKRCRVGGFIAPGYWQGTVRSGFDLKEIETGRTIPLAKREAPFKQGINGGYIFSEDALQTGKNLINQSAVSGAGIILIDEIGRFELTGRVWAGALEQLLQSYNGTLVLTVRKSLTESVTGKWKIHPEAVFDISSVTAVDAADRIYEATLNKAKQVSDFPPGSKPPPKTPVIDDIWLKAAVAGGLWASVEIILGSFLHNLRVPMAGSVLASFGIVLMVAFFRIWPEGGLIWRAGLICALMKSVSPSAVILGPMTGILMEALLLEAGIALVGRNLAGYLFGGALALFSALLHKVISLLILYGLNIVTIYLNLFQFAARQINIPEADPWQIILALSGIYLIAGALAAFAGYLIGGRSAKAIPVEVPATAGFGLEPGPDIFEPSEGKFSLLLFFMHISAIPAGLILINHTGRPLAYPLLILYTGFCILYYKRTIRRFKKPLFWFQLLVIAILAAIFLESTGDGMPSLNWRGVLAGIDMNIRAVLVVAGFSALSTELKNPVITRFLFRKGFSQLYLAISLAFRALPAMMEEISRPGRFLTQPFASLTEMVAGSKVWLENITKNSNLKNF